MVTDATRREVYEDGWPDGWTIREEKTSRGYDLHLAFDPGKSGALPIDRLVWSAKEWTDKSVGELARMRCLWEGLARYLNSGGDMADLLDSVQLCGIDLPLIAPPDFYLVETLQEVDQAEHIFLSESGDEVVDWAEGASVELLSRAEFEDRMEEEESEFESQADYVDEFRDGLGR